MAQRRSIGIKKLPSGRYQIDFRDPDGVRHRESFDREKDARAAIDARRTAVRKREYVPPAKIPIVEEAAKTWLEGRKVSESKHGGLRKRSTIKFWENHINNFINPTLGKYRLDCVDTALVEAQREVWKASGLTAPSINKVLATLTAILNKQVSLRVISFNPAALAERMARGTNQLGENDDTDVDRLEVRPDEVYGPAELRTLIAAAEPGLPQTLIMTYALTGMRHNEALALKWHDIDFDAGEITIRRNWSDEYQNGEPAFTAPKTKNSVRKVPIPDELVLALKKWKLQCPPSKWEMVFPKPDGRPQDRKTTWRIMDRTVKAINKDIEPGEQPFRRRTVHSLRHSFASIHISNGTPIAEASAMLGHADIAITLKVYTHFIRTMKTDSSSRLAALIFTPEKPTGNQLGHLKDTSAAQAANS